MVIHKQINQTNPKPKELTMSWLYKRKNSPYFWWGAFFKGKRLLRSTKMKQLRLAQKVQSDWDLKLSICDLSFLGKRIKNIPSKTSIKDISIKFLNLRSRKSNNALAVAKGVINKLQEFLLIQKIKYIDEITIALHDKYIDWLACASKTKKNHLQVISLMMDQAVKEKIITENPCKAVTLPTITKVDKHRYLENEDLSVIFDNSGKWDTYFKFLYFTGLRAGDVAMLKYGNINQDKKAIVSLVRKSRRIHQFPLADDLIDLLPESQDSRSPLFPELYAITDRKLNDNLAKPRKYLQKILKVNGRPKATLHSFRTTYNNILRNLGLSIEDRQILLAHSASETTKIYTHPNFELARKFVNKIPEIGKNNVTIM